MYHPICTPLPFPLRFRVPDDAASANCATLPRTNGVGRDREKVTTVARCQERLPSRRPRYLFSIVICSLHTCPCSRSLSPFFFSSHSIVSHGGALSPFWIILTLARSSFPLPSTFFYMQDLMCTHLCVCVCVYASSRGRFFTASKNKKRSKRRGGNVENRQVEQAT